MNLALAAAIEAVRARVPGDAPVADRVIAAKVIGLMVGYDARWAGTEWCLVGSPEVVVRLPIVNPDTGRTSRTFSQAGKFDGVLRGYGRTVLFEAKSTSEDIADPTGPYFRRLRIDSQVSKYMLQSWQAGLKLDGCLYDVTRKPGIRPKNIPRAELAAIGTTGLYCGFPVDAATKVAIREGLTEETPELYALRLVRETLSDPARYFQRLMVPRLDDELVEYSQELWQIADEIRMSRLSGRHYRNSGACMNFGQACEYLSLCSGEDTPASDRWRRAENVHDELPDFDGGRDVLTNSRLKCFQTCRRKHHLRYEVGLRRVHEEEAEALFFGRVWHEAIAAWWEAHSANKAA